MKIKKLWLVTILAMFIGMALPSPAAAALVLVSPTDAVAEHSRLGSDTPGQTGATGNTRDASGFTSGIVVAEDPTESGTNIWYVTTYGAGGTAADVNPEYVYYDLGSSMSVVSVVLWNDNTQLNNTDSGMPSSYVADAGGQRPNEIAVSTTTGTPASFTWANMDALSWTAQLSAQAVSTTVGTGQTFAFSSPVSTRYLQVNVTGRTGTTTPGTAETNHIWYGFNEFAVYTPEPATVVVLIASAAGMLLGRRKNRLG